jgi:phage-related protein
MPATTILFYLEDGEVPALEFLARLSRKARAKAVARLRLLAAEGHELRRPYADLLRDDIHELRATYEHLQFRLLYFFHGQRFIVVAHGLQKEDEVPNREIERALTRRERYLADPAAHAADVDLED